MIFCVRYLETLSGDRELRYAARLTLAIGVAELRIYVQCDRAAAALVAGEERVAEVLKLREQAVRQRCSAIAQLPESQIGFEFFEGTLPNFPNGAIAVGQRYAEERPCPGVHALVPDSEVSIEQRGGPLVIPFGNRNTALRAAELGMRLAKLLERKVILYHSTWRSNKVNSDEPRENMCPAAIEVMGKLEQLSSRLGVQCQTVVEMAPDVTLGIRNCAGAHFASLLICAFGRWKGGAGGSSGSHVTKLVKQTAYPLLIVQEEEHHA
jgi:hypothetical protein